MEDRPGGRRAGDGNRAVQRHRSRVAGRTIVSCRRIAQGGLAVVPLKYNLRSLRARKVGSLMTIFGTGMVVWASIFAFGLYGGLENTFEMSVNPLDIIVL